MKKLWSLALVSAALLIALPTVASAHDWHGHRGHRGHGHRHGHHGHVRAFIPVPVPVPQPVYYAPSHYYPAPPAYYPVAVPVPVTPFIAVRTPRVAVSIGGFFPY